MRYRSIAPCAMAIIVDSMGFGLVYPIMTALFAGDGSPMSEGLSLHLRNFYLGLGFLLYPLCMFFGASFMGDLSDIVGRKKSLVLCMSGICLSFLLMGLGVSIRNIGLLMIGRSLSGLMAGSQPIAQAAIVDLSTPKTKARNLSLMTLVLSLGIIIGPLMGGLFSDPAIVHWFTLSTPFYIAALLSFITALWIWKGFHDASLKHRKLRLDWMRPITIFIEGFQHSQIRQLAVIFLLMQTGFSIFFQLIQVVMAEFFHYASWQLGVFNGYIGLSFAIVTLVGAQFLFKYISVGQVAVLTLTLTGISMILSMLFPSQIPIWIFSFITAGFDMVAYAALMTSFSNAVDEKRQGWVMGIFGSIMAISWAVTGLSTNLIPLIGLRGLIVIGGFFMLLSALLMMFYNNRHQSTSVSPSLNPLL